MRINSRQVCSFVQVAINAGKREVLEIITASALSSNTISITGRTMRSNAKVSEFIPIY